MIQVHHGRRTRSVRVLWLLEELGIPYQIEPVEFDYDKLRSPEHRLVHPLGQLPVMVDGDLKLIESGAILEYILDRYGEGRLMPERGTAERGLYYQWFHYGEASIARHVSDLVIHRFGPEAERVPQVLELVRRRLREALAYADEQLAGRDFILGAEFSAADIMMSYGMVMARITRELPQEFGNVAAYLGRLKARPAYDRVWA